MKKIFEDPKLTIVLFANEDIIVTSGGIGENWGGQPGDESQDPVDED